MSAVFRQPANDAPVPKLVMGHELAMSLRRAYLSMHRATNACLAESGATADQFVVLSSLAENGPMPQAELAESTFSDPNTISAMLRRLEEQGYVARKRHQTDGRVRMVSLTRRGRRIQSELSTATATLRQRLEGYVEATQLNDLVVCLNHVAARIESPIEP